MKVIFLDHDGVICLFDNWGSRYKKQKKWDGRKLSMPFHEIPIKYRFDNFNKKAVAVLNEILEKTGAEIVISSDWRYHATIEELGEYYELQGVIKKPIAVTGIFKDIYPNELSCLRHKAELELERSMEIDHWLSNHLEITNWVAVDDLNLGIDFLSSYFISTYDINNRPGLTNFVHTYKSGEGIKQSGIKEKIIKFLNQ